MAKNYGIMRIEKRKATDVTGIQMEANRTKETAEKFGNSDIDITKTNSNIYLKKTNKWRTEINKIIKENGLKTRKDSVVMLDGFYGASPEFFKGKNKKEILDYFKDCLNFHIETYCQGSPKLLINAVIHTDETTPHMQLASVPVVKDQKGMHLSAKIIMGGRKQYRERQDKFFQQVSKHWNLERGEVRKNPKEIKKHKQKRDWEIEEQEQQLNININNISSMEKAINSLNKQFKNVIINGNLEKSLKIVKNLNGRNLTSKANLQILEQTYRDTNKLIKSYNPIFNAIKSNKQLATQVADINTLNKQRMELTEQVNSLNKQLDRLKQQTRKTQNRAYMEQFINKNKKQFKEFVKTLEKQKELEI